MTDRRSGLRSVTGEDRPIVLSTGVRLRLGLVRWLKSARRNRRRRYHPDKPYGLHGKRLTGDEGPRLRLVEGSERD